MPRFDAVPKSVIRHNCGTFEADVGHRPSVVILEPRLYRTTLVRMPVLAYNRIDHNLSRLTPFMRLKEGGGGKTVQHSSQFCNVLRIDQHLPTRGNHARPRTKTRLLSTSQSTEILQSPLAMHCTSKTKQIWCKWLTIPTFGLRNNSSKPNLTANKSSHNSSTHAITPSHLESQRAEESLRKLFFDCFFGERNTWNASGHRNWR